MKKGMKVTLSCNLQSGNQGIRFNVPANGAAVSWPIPKGAHGSVEQSNDNEVLVMLTWNSTGIKDIHHLDLCYIWVKRHMMGSLFDY